MLEADHWVIAMLLASCGGLGLPDLKVYAAVARTAAPATIPDMPDLQTYLEAVVRNAEDHLRHVLQPSLPIALKEVAGSILQMPAGKSTTQLTRKLMHQVHHKSVSNAWRRRGAFPAGLRYGWLRNLTRDDAEKLEGFSGQGVRLRALSTDAATTIPDRAYRWGLQQRLGQGAPHTGQRY